MLSPPREKRRREKLSGTPPSLTRSVQALTFSTPTGDFSLNAAEHQVHTGWKHVSIAGLSTETLLAEAVDVLARDGLVKRNAASAFSRAEVGNLTFPTQ